MRILAISGSLKESSANTALIRSLQELADGNAQIGLYAGLDSLPHFNPDLEPGPTQVQEFRQELSAADGVVISTPEYAHSLPGALKDALDWLVGSGELYGKPVALLSASSRREGGARARAALEQTLRAQGARVVFSATVRVPQSGDPGQHLQTEATAGVLRHALVALRTPVSEQPDFSPAQSASEADAAFFQALRAADVDSLEKLLAPDFRIVDVSSGAVADRGDLISAVASGRLVFASIATDPADSLVREFGATVIIIGRTAMIIATAGAPAFSVASRYTHVFLRGDRGWRLVSAQGTPIAAGS